MTATFFHFHADMPSLHISLGAVRKYGLGDRAGPRVLCLSDTVRLWGLATVLGPIVLTWTSRGYWKFITTPTGKSLLQRLRRAVC